MAINVDNIAGRQHQHGDTGQQAQHLGGHRDLHACRNRLPVAVSMRPLSAGSPLSLAMEGCKITISAPPPDIKKT
jgi:hypothetical protein